MDSNYWDSIYQKKSEKEVSWFQEVPRKSLELIESFNLALDANIIDIGGGDSRLVDCLLERGLNHLSVLDISAISLKKLKERLGADASRITYIESDIVAFRPSKSYQLWHDRATFHFLTDLEQIEKYLSIAHDALAIGGHLIVSTFSKTGPEKCSGLSTAQYSEDDLKKLFGRFFKNIKCFEDTHQTPWGATQNFVYCGFKKV
ncbi:MAG: class I SAM-dependent methyltransferase [Bdellovibrio sp.]|nr:class I SAM-dependent methyltransferase [Bdellovibrio sp.]